MDGNITLGDNMSDNGGLKLAYDAYRVWAKGHGVEPRLPGLQEYTPQQMFWLSYANVWCSKDTLKSLKYRMTDVHSLNRFRIIGSFSNKKFFSDDFRCPLGSNMNPVKKCHVWWDHTLRLSCIYYYYYYYCYNNYDYYFFYNILYV